MTGPSWLEEVLGPVAAVHAVFDQQGSGNVAYGVTLDEGRRVFVKVATTAVGREGLARAVRLHRAVQHPTIVPLEAVHETPDGQVLVYPWVEGELLYAASQARGGQGSAHGRFRALPVEQVNAALDELFDAHRVLAAAGFVSSDFYDGSLLYDFVGARLWLIDLDEYRPGPFRLEAERALGSTRFMAPEEFVRGSVIDERTTVFHLARAATVFLGDGEGGFRGAVGREEVVRRGQEVEPERRFDGVAAFVEAWRRAGGAS